MEEDIYSGKIQEILDFEKEDGFEIISPEEVERELTVDTTWVVEWRGKDGWRCRLVGREYKALDKNRDDLFGATTSPATSRVIDSIAVMKGYPTFTGDARKAYFQVYCDEEAFVDPLVEFQEILKSRILPLDMK